jgi:sugar/nucleoside kinase (ribokinase family)
MPEKIYDLLVIGELNIDLILSGGDLRPRFGQAEQLGEDAVLALGSSSAILACGVACLGMKVTFSGEVGVDEFGSFVLSQLEKRGVDNTQVSIAQDGKTGVTVHLSLPHDRSMLTYPGTMATFSGARIPEDLIRQARHVHMSSYFLQPGVQPYLASIFATARRAGATTSLDTGWDPSEVWESGLQEVLPGVDIFLPNEREAMAIARAENCEQAVVKLAETVPLVVVKRGEHGALAHQAGRDYAVPAFKVTPVETTGAGDNFNAGFLYARLKGLPLEDCLRWGAACGAIATLQPGGLDGQRPAAEVQAWMSAQGRPVTV